MQFLNVHIHPLSLLASSSLHWSQYGLAIIHIWWWYFIVPEDFSDLLLLGKSPKSSRFELSYLWNLILTTLHLKLNFLTCKLLLASTQHALSGLKTLSSLHKTYLHFSPLYFCLTYSSFKFPLRVCFFQEAMYSPLLSSLKYPSSVFQELPYSHILELIRISYNDNVYLSSLPDWNLYKNTDHT